MAHAVKLLCASHNTHSHKTFWPCLHRWSDCSIFGIKQRTFMVLRGNQCSLKAQRGEQVNTLSGMYVATGLVCTCTVFRLLLLGKLDMICTVFFFLSWCSGDQCECTRSWMACPYLGDVLCKTRGWTMGGEVTWQAPGTGLVFNLR